MRTLVVIPDLRDAVALGVGDGSRLVPGGDGVDNHFRMALGRGDEAHVCNVGCAQDAELEGVIFLGRHGWPEHEPVATQSTQECCHFDSDLHGCRCWECLE